MPLKDKTKANAYHREYNKRPHVMKMKREYTRAYRKRNIEKSRMWSRENMAKRVRLGLYDRMKWYRENTEKAKASHRDWCRANRDKINAYERAKQKTNLNHRLAVRLRSNVNYAVKFHTGKRKAASIRTLSLFGCPVEVLRQWLESQFTGIMSWSNHGNKGWHIDHVRPCASFDLSNAGQLAQCFHFTNLQPLWWIDNIRKSDNYEPQ